MKILLNTALILGLISQAGAVKMPSVFGNGMILQRNKPVSFWGKGKPGESITLTFGKIALKTKAAADSTWKLLLPAQPAGGPHILLVKGTNELRFEDVHFGEVWLASGQSNMEWKLKQGVVNQARETKDAQFPGIRFIEVQNRPSAKPQSDFVTKGWKTCSPETAPDLSAVAYFFAREIHRKLDIPIGLILCEWGGTPAEAWTSREALQPFPEFNEAIGNLPEAELDLPTSGQFKNLLKAFNESLVKNDSGTIKQWWKPETSTHNWSSMTIPGLWEQAGLEGFDGAVWFRREFEVPASLASENKFWLGLSTIDDMDSTWVNGVKLGGIRGYDRKRSYPIPAGLIRPGKNVVTVRVIDWTGGGGIWGNKDEIRLSGKEEVLSLAGEWKYKVGAPARALSPLGDDKRMQNLPTALFNGMLHPLIPYSIQGVIWYQGESNVTRAKQYQSLFPAMIQDWRSRFGQGNFPFLFVQLANYMKPDTAPSESTWAELREAQFKTLSLPNTGMATAVDIGEANDIHPKNKQDVGKRLALLALCQVYGQNNPCQNPVAEKVEKEGASMKVSFKHVYQGMKIKSRYGYVQGFALAGQDKKFHWAAARLEGNQIRVTSPLVPEPVYLRYGWANNPDDLNVYNSADLPLIPFRTDP